MASAPGQRMLRRTARAPSRLHARLDGLGEKSLWLSCAHSACALAKAINGSSYGPCAQGRRRGALHLTVPVSMLKPAHVALNGTVGSCRVCSLTAGWCATPTLQRCALRPARQTADVRLHSINYT